MKFSNKNINSLLVFSVMSLFIFFTNTKGQIKTDINQNEEKLLAEEIEVKKFAEIFIKNLEEIKDLNQLPKSLFANNFKDNFSQPKSSFVKDNGFASQLSSRELYEYNTLLFNFNYLASMWNLGNKRESNNEDSNKNEDEQFFPPSIFDSIKSNENLYSLLIKQDNNSKIENLTELHNFISELKAIVENQKKYLDEKSSEWKNNYSKNIQRIYDDNYGYDKKPCERNVCPNLDRNSVIYEINFTPFTLKIVKVGFTFKILDIDPY